MDFYKIRTVKLKDGSLQLRPDWKVGKTSDLMTRAGTFYAVWDEDRQLWSTDIYDVVRLVDQDLYRRKMELEARDGTPYLVASLEDNSSKLWQEFNTYIRNSGNNSHNLDERLIFANTEVTKNDYASRRLSYSLYEGDHSAWDSLVGTLYNEEERAKIEWAIGAVVSGDSKSIQKFMVFYGPPGSGKSTILNIVEQLFNGYTSVFDARELAGNNNAFATSAFKSNPLVAIQHDGDLSRIYDNTKLNSIVAHEIMPMNEKYQKVVEMRVNAFLFMGTNLPVKITDAKAGIIRRLIDIVPTGQTIEHDLYHALMHQIDFELGAIAEHCLQRYLAMGRNYYSGYRPTEMMLQTDVFYNYVEAHLDVFKSDGVSLQRAWGLYKEFCTETGIDKMLPQYKFREELKNYFYGFDARTTVDGTLVRSYYRGFKGLEPSPPITETPVKPEGVYEIILSNEPSIFDEVFSAQPAQAGNSMGKPPLKWAESKTKLSDIDTHELHYVKVPENHIVIDFDIKDESGEKNLQLSIDEALKWPPTYTEVSKSGFGLHLHYTYTGDVSMLSSIFAPGIEIKTLRGDASLRRKLTACNKLQIMPLADGTLPKKDKAMIGPKSIQTEKGLRLAIERNLRKEHHPSTKSSIDFIHHILEESYASGLAYNVEDMRRVIYTFAAQSTNQASQAIKTVQTMKFVGKSELEAEKDVSNEPVVFYDVEVFSNLFVVCWKVHGIDTVASMVNPTPEELEPLLKKKLVGFNNRRYDNHILYAAFLGESVEELYARSQRLILGGNNDRSGYIGAAYDLSYADIYDFSSVKQGLKKFEIQLGIHHQELDLPWDKPVREEDIARVVDYCKNDVVATEAVFDDRAQDFVARQILASLSGMTVNHTTQNHTAKIIFGEDKNPQTSFVYTNLENEFPGYHFDGKESTYRGEVTGEGGYVFSKPGVYEDVIELDIASMHPTSIVELNLFGNYTSRFEDLLEARLAIKAKNYDRARVLLDGKLEPFLNGSDEDADKLAYALKIVINIVYGLTSAKFPNMFRDDRNKDNIVAKRGALFMIDLKHYMEDLGYNVIHIKTDSIKIPVGSGDKDEIIRIVSELGKRHGYTFEVDHIYKRFCLVNDAVYIATDGEKWTAVGAQFQHPYVFKTLFTKEELVFDDWCETKSVLQGTMYLDFDNVDDVEKWVHIGRTGVFMPVINGGGFLWRYKEEKKYAVVGTKGHRWITRDMGRVRELDQDLIIDQTYFQKLVDDAEAAITKYAIEAGKTFDWFAP